MFCTEGGECLECVAKVVEIDTIVGFKTLLDRPNDMQGAEGYGLCAGRSWHQSRHRHCEPKGLFLHCTVPLVNCLLQNLQLFVLHLSSANLSTPSTPSPCQLTDFYLPINPFSPVFTYCLLALAPPLSSPPLLYVDYTPFSFVEWCQPEISIINLPRHMLLDPMCSSSGSPFL